MNPMSSKQISSFIFAADGAKADLNITKGDGLLDCFSCSIVLPSIYPITLDNHFANNRLPSICSIRRYGSNFAITRPL